LLTRTNYLIGKDPRQWKTDVPNYARVSYAQVYPGTDLVYYGNDGELEFDFAVAPGTDPSEIHLAIRGAKTLAKPNGDVVLRAQGTQIVLRNPRLYQFLGGHKRPISGHYEIDRRNVVRFMIGAYDRGKQLVIDPALAYSNLLGGWGV